MPKREKTLELANLICRFGDEKVLIDLLEEIVIPAFTDTALVRSYSTTSYLFHQVKLIVLDEKEGVLGIGGRLIKNTTLKREQVLDPQNGLIHDEKQLASSPSSLFLLVVNSHRLLYVKETADAPSLDSFKSTLEKFLDKKHAYY